MHFSPKYSPFFGACPYHVDLFCRTTVIISSILSLSLSYTWTCLLPYNQYHTSTAVYHAQLRTFCLQLSSQKKGDVLIGTPQLPEFIPSLSCSSLNSCINVSIYALHVADAADLIRLQWLRKTKIPSVLRRLAKGDTACLLVTFLSPAKMAKLAPIGG